MQWNCRGLMNKKTDLVSISKDFDILLLCETFLKPDKLFTFNKNFNIIRADRAINNRGGLAIVIRRGIAFSRVSSIINIKNNLETLSVSIDTSAGQLLIVSVYRVPLAVGRISQETWSGFLESVTTVNASNVFIGGDFNSHHHLWGSSHICQNGKTLCLALDESEFICLNSGKPTLVNRPDNSPSILDLTFVSPRLFAISNHDVWDDALGSDHYPVVTRLGVRVPISDYHSHKYNLRRIDWASFSSNLKNLIGSRTAGISAELDPVLRYNSFVECVDEAVLAAAPSSPSPGPINHNLTPKTRPFIPAPWWNDECDNAIKDRRKALKKFRKRSNYSNYLEYKKTEAKAKRTLNEARRGSFQKFCESLDRTSSIFRVWRVIKTFKNKFTQPATSSCSADREVIAKLHELVLEMCPTTVFQDNFPAGFGPNQFLEAPFSENELKIAISSLKTKSSPGLDKIDNNIINHFPDEARSALLKIYNDMLLSSSFPPSWNEFLVFFIPKSTPGKFRPISLASCTFKLMEKLIHNRLIWYLEHNFYLSPSQFCFRKSRSCADNLALLSTEIWTGFVKGEVTAGLFLDLKGAFPSVVPQILMEDLKDVGIPKSIAKFIYKSVACKRMFFNINGELVGPRISTVGLPWGCILSPILFFLYTRKLYGLLPPGCTIIEFADDIVILFRSRDPRRCIRALQRCLNMLAEFLSQRGLEICPEKTKLVLFNKLNLNLNDPIYNLKINDFLITPSLNVKFLEIIFRPLIYIQQSL